MNLKNKFFKVILILFSFTVLGTKGMANYELKVIVKFSFLSSFTDSLGNTMEDSLVRNREFRVILYNNDKSDSLSHEQTTNDSGFAIFDFDYWHDDSPVDPSNIKQIALDFPHSNKYTKIGDNYDFVPLKFDSVPFTDNAPEEITVVLPMSTYLGECTIGDGPYCFDFVVMADMHIASGKKYINGYSDFGSVGWNDYDCNSSERTQAISNNEAIVGQINRLIAQGDTIRFVILAGDLTVSAESSEFQRTKSILNLLDPGTFYIPIFGNHDGWPYVGQGGYYWEQPNNEVVIGKYFHNAFDTQFDSLRITFPIPNWQESPLLSTPTDITGESYHSYYFNFAFNFQQYHFVSTDFCTRTKATLGGGLNGPPDVNRGSPWGYTWDWLHDNITDEKMIALGHHPYCISIGSNFSQPELDDIAEAGLLYKEPTPVSIGGHNHPFRFYDYVYTSYGGPPFCYAYSVGDALEGYFYLFHVRDSVKLEITQPPAQVTLPVTNSFSYTYSRVGPQNEPQNATSSYRWDFGDNSQPYVGSNPPTHTYHPQNHLLTRYKVTLTVTTCSNRKVSIAKMIDVLASPYNLQTEFVHEDEVKLVWDMDHFDPNYEHFKIKRNGEFLDYSSAKEYVDASVEPGQSYSYEVCDIFDGNYESPWIGINDVQTPWLDSPSNLSYELITLNQIRLDWVDNSNHESGFEIARKINSGSWDEHYASVGMNVTQFLDNISSGNRYYYKVKAVDGWFHPSYWSDEIEVFSAVANSASPLMTALNNTSRIAYGGGKLHLAYTGTKVNEYGETVTCIYYTYSTDNGKSWTTPEIVPWSEGAEYPALALNSANIPYILFEKWQELEGGGGYLYPHAYISRKINSTWESDTTILPGGGMYPKPQGEPYSLFFDGDAVYLALPRNPGTTHYLRFLKYHPNHNPKFFDGMDWENVYSLFYSPSVILDPLKRIIVAYIRDGRIYLMYKDPPPYPPNTNLWSDPIQGPYIPCLKDYSVKLKGLNLYIATGACDYSGPIQDGVAKVWKVARNQGGSYDWENEFTYNNEVSPLGSPSPVILDNGDCLVWSNSIDTIYYTIRNVGNGNWEQPKALYVSNAGISSIYPQAYIIPMGVDRLLCAAWTDSISDGQHSGPPYWISYANAKLPVWRVPADNATGPNNGELLTVDAATGNIHTVFNTGSTIAYTKSTDKGGTWTDVVEVDSGANPSIILDSFGLTRISYVKNDTVFCKILKPDSTWKTVVVYAGDENGKPWTPVIAQTYPKELAQNCYCVYPLKNPSDNLGKAISLSEFDIRQDNAPPPQEVVTGDNLNSPSIAVTPGDYIHIAWEENGEIFYRTSLEKIVPGQDIVWSDIYNVSESPEVISEHPVIEAYGENIIVAWKEGNEGEPGEIFRRIRNLSKEGIVWFDIENISQSPNNESDYPVLSSMDVVAWQEKVDSLNWEISAWIKGDIVNLSETENSSKYPHIAVEPQKATDDGNGGITIDPKIAINAIWTEEITPESLYEVKFRRYEHDPSSDKLSEYIKVDVGDSTPSSYCEHRTGFVDYGEFSCDYSSSPLLYNLPYLNPKSNYALRAVVYREGSGTQSEEMYVDTTFVTEVVYTPYVPETVCVLLPKETYENDLEVSKEIERVLGSYALLADLKIYEVSLADSSGGGGGAQGNRRDIRRYTLYQNRPNPFKDLTKIAFALPRECKVSLFVYNVTGRRVRTLIDEKMKPGNYNLKWDGKDNHNRNLAQGIYFYRLQTEDFKDTKKTVLLK